MKHFLLLSILFPLFSMAQTVGNNVLPNIELPPLPIKEDKVIAFNAKFPDLAEMTKLTQDWFYWTNYSRAEPRKFYDSVVAPLLVAMPILKGPNATSLKKELYQSPALPMLRPNSDLKKVAEHFADEMTKRNASPSHNSPSGSTFQSRMESIKIKFCAGENISWGKPNTALMLALLFIDEGVSDLGHRKTLLDASFTEMGIGYNVYPDGKYMVVQDFVCSQPR